MNFNQPIVRNSAILSSTIDDETVMMSMEKGMYYNLNPVASTIWQLLESPQTLDSLCEKLMQEYEVDETTCRQETIELLESLNERNLIQSA
jgi:hypothetical protein